MPPLPKVALTSITWKRNLAFEGRIPMSWQNLVLSAPDQLLDRIETRLIIAGALAISLTDAGDVAILEPAPGTTPVWPQSCLTALFPANLELAPLTQVLEDEFSLSEPIRITPLEDQPWERACMADFHAMRFGQRLWIYPSWEAPPDSDAVNLCLDPGLAFGTGAHSTTALCLEWLDAHPPTRQLLVDYGCGSGILSLAALKLEAHQVWAIDIDPQALTATENNAKYNGISPDSLYVVEPDGLPSLKADLVIANILSGPLAELAPTLSELIKPGGQLLLSGILENQVDTVRSAYADDIESWEPVVDREGWVRLVGTRNQSRG